MARRKNQRFTAEKTLSRITAYGTITPSTKVEIDVEIGFKENGDGWFEFYDVKSGGEKWYASGILELDGDRLTGYDGIFELPDFIIARLEKLGFQNDL